MRIATWNVNSVNARIEAVLRWFEEAQPDVPACRRSSASTKKIPREAFERLGYNVAVRGQKSYNGVAMLSEDPAGGRPQGPAPATADGGEHARYFEAVVSGPAPRAGGLDLSAQRQSDRHRGVPWASSTGWRG